MAPKKDQLDKLSWSWVDGLNVNDIKFEHLELAYKIRLKVCGNCRKNCGNNPRCLHGLGEHKFLNKTNIENKITSEDKKDILCRIRSKDTFVGLKNLGATCYINSLLQVWFHNHKFRNALYKWNPIYDDDEKANFLNHSDTDFISYEPLSVIGHLQLIFALLEFSNQNIVNPTCFVNSLMIDAGTQQDLQEFSKLFMSLIESKFIYQEDMSVKQSIFDQFRGNYSYVTRCQNCKMESRRKSHFFELELNIKNNKTINDCIKEFLIEEKMENQDQYFCGICQSKQNATRSIELDELPPVLNLQLLRFVYDIKTQTKKKLSSFIQFPEVLDMSDFLNNEMNNTSTSNKRNLKYKLTAVLIHNGVSAYSGHYITHIFVEPEKVWYRFNDEIVEEIKTVQKSDIVNLENNFTETNKKGVKRPRTPKGYISSNNAYMLVYKLLDDISSDSVCNTSTEQKSLKIDDAVKLTSEDLSYNKENKIDSQSQNSDDSKTDEHVVSVSNELESTVVNKCIKDITDPEEANENGEPQVNKIKTTKNKNTQKNNGPSLILNGNFELISDEKLINSDLPKYLKTLVLNENQKFTDEIKTLEEMQNVSTASLVAKQSEIKYFYDEAKIFADEYEFIPKEWLQKWFLMESNVPIPISNKYLMCIHGNLNPLKINFVKIVSKTAADHLYLNFSGGPRLTNENLCLECVKKRCELIQLKAKITEDQKVIQNTLKKPDMNETSFWIGKYSFRNWKRFVLDQFKEIDQPETLSQSPTYTSNSQTDDDELKQKDNADVVKSEESIMDFSKTDSDLCNIDMNGDKLNTDIKSSQEEPNQNESQADMQIDEFNSEILCSHNSLSTDESTRKLIPKKVYQILLKYFPNLKTFDMNTPVCETCLALTTKNQLKKDYYINIATEQRELLKDLFVGINRPTCNQSMALPVIRTDGLTNGGTVSDMYLTYDKDMLKTCEFTEVPNVSKSDIVLTSSVEEKTEINKEVELSSTEDKLCEKLNSESCVESNEKLDEKKEEKLYVVSAEFISMWRKFLRNNGRNEDLDTIENSILICSHGKLIYYPNSDKVVLVTIAEWTTLQNYFTFDNEIEIIKSSSGIIINPEICKTCAEHNITYKVIVRKISPDLDEENSTLERTIPPKKVKLAEKEVPCNNNSPSIGNNTTPQLNTKSPKPTKISKSLDASFETDLIVRRSKRRKMAGNERQIHINSNCSLKDLKLKIMEQFQVAPFDQNLTFDGIPLIDNSVIISDLGFYENCIVILKADEPNSEQSFLDEIHCNQREEGFKGTGLLS